MASQQYRVFQSMNIALHFFRTSRISFSNMLGFFFFFFPQPYFIDFSAEVLHIICEIFPKVVNVVLKNSIARISLVVQ